MTIRYSKDHMNKLHVKLPQTKVCNTCNSEKPLKEFNKNSKSKDNRRNKCRECSTDYQRRYKAEHREKRNKP